MNKFDRDRICVKCGFPIASIKYCKRYSNVEKVDNVYEKSEGYGEEVIIRNCQCCSFSWIEWPLDKK